MAHRPSSSALSRAWVHIFEDTCTHALENKVIDPIKRSDGTRFHGFLYRRFFFWKNGFCPRNAFRPGWTTAVSYMVIFVYLCGLQAKREAFDSLRSLERTAELSESTDR